MPIYSKRLVPLLFGLPLIACGSAPAAGGWASPGTEEPAPEPEEEVLPNEEVDPEPAPPVEEPPPVATEPSLAENVTLSDIAFFQTVKIPVVTAGARVSKTNAPLVSGRASLLRLYVKPTASFNAKSLRAVVTFQAPGQKDVTLTDEKRITGASSEASLATTFQVKVPASVLVEGATFRAELVDMSKRSPAWASSAHDARFPRDGSMFTPTLVSASTLKIVLVPFRYDADGSKRLPDTSTEQIARYKNVFDSLYPASAISISVRAPVTISTQISANGAGFDDALESLVRVRKQDRVASDVYYLGVFAPASTFSRFCGTGCVAGLSPVTTDPSDSDFRVSVGVGFSGDESAWTAAHELGHAHGREHAPCGQASGTDPRFPYAKGSIGSWGYNMTKEALLDPASVADMMGYCRVQWVSDYTYKAIYERMKSIGAVTKTLSASAPATYRFLRVSPEGEVTWGGRVELDTPPKGEPVAVRLADEEGAVRDWPAYRYAFGDRAGGMWLIAEPLHNVAYAELAGVPRLAPRLDVRP